MYDKNTVLIDRREMLRVKAKSLAEEAHLIRREERRTRGLLRDELRWHRTGVVRFEARATHLAYGIIRGRSIDRIEKSSTRRYGMTERALATSRGGLRLFTLDAAGKFLRDLGLPRFEVDATGFEPGRMRPARPDRATALSRTRRQPKLL